MIIVSLFELIHNIDTGIYTIITLLPIYCPLCGGAVYYRDRKTRDVKRLNGEVWHFRLRRMLCEVCEKLHTEIPELIQPYKHYDSETIQSIIDGNEDAKACGADDSTIQRWKSEFKKATPDIEQRLASVYVRETDEHAPLVPIGRTLTSIRAAEPYWLAFVMALLINNGYKLCTQFAFCPSQCCANIQYAGKKSDGGFNKNDKTNSDTG